MKAQVLHVFVEEGPGEEAMEKGKKVCKKTHSVRQVSTGGNLVAFWGRRGGMGGTKGGDTGVRINEIVESEPRLVQVK